MISPAVAQSILSGLRSSPMTGFPFRREAMAALAQLPGYNWTGIYRLDDHALQLDAFVGAPTEHGRIEVGVGVCGTAIAENRNQLISDVREISNYLACSLQTRSEIVVLIREGDRILGQIDVDGHEAGAFDRGDEEFLERLAALIAERWN